MTTTTLTKPTAPRDIDAGEEYLMASENTWDDLKKQLAKRLSNRKKLKRDPVWEAFRRLPPDAVGGSMPIELAAAYRLLIAQPHRKKKQGEPAAEPFDWSAAAKALDTAASDPPALLIWADALPQLFDQLDEPLWWEVLGKLKAARETALNDLPAGCSRRLISAAELGLVLAWGLKNFRTSVRLASSSWDAFKAYLNAEDERLQDLLTAGGERLPAALASGLRCVRISQDGFKQKPTRRLLGELNEMSAWYVHLVRWNGSLCFKPLETLQTGALMDAASATLDDPGLRKAYAFARRSGDKSQKHRLSTEVELPESGMYCGQARLVSMRPSWFKHHGWIVAGFESRASPHVEVSAGKRMILEGPWETSIRVDGRDCQPQADWEEVCWHSDDEVHYLEMEQCWTHGVTLQRQLMVVREDGAVLLADTVLAADQARIDYQSQVPVAASLRSQPDAETREIVLADDKPRAMVLPIGLSEWRVGASPGSLNIDEGRLVLNSRGQSRLYAPLWIDFERRRFTRPRTWRNLTVASRLQISKPHEAVASRVQFGSEQWIVFRAMGEPDAWTFCGKHLAADFFCGRFDPEDGSVEELITVDTPAETQAG